MHQVLRYLLLSVCLCTFGKASILNFSGTVASTSGNFSSAPGLAAGNRFSGSANIVGVDLDLDPSLGSGFFPVLDGQLNVYTNGISPLQYSASSASMRVATTTQLTGDTLSIRVYYASDYLEVFLHGSDGFLANDSFPLNDNGINWDLFTGGTAVFERSAILTRSMAVISSGDSINFTIDQASQVPEPGTLLLVPAGALAFYLRRRTQVR